MYILGIESSCDESAAAIIKFNKKTKDIEVLANIISSQIEIHKKYGGVVPEIAAREHVLNILPVINDAFRKAKIKPQDLDLISVTKGPGLITSLITGVETVRALAYAWNKPVLEINHIDGHIYSNFIKPHSPIKFPAIILTVSGGHTILLRMTKNHNIKILGETRDDAAGEAFDKGAKMLGLEYPGGPIVACYAQKYKEKLKKQSKKIKNNYRPIILPRPMLNSQNFDFSFSGLKTALLYQLKKDPKWKKRIPEYCFEFQQAIIDSLISKTIKAAQKFKAQSILLSGGVSANQELREQLAKKITKKLKKTNFLVPNKKYTTDNAVMIATAAAYKINKQKKLTFKDLRVDSGLQLK